MVRSVLRKRSSINILLLFFSLFSAFSLSNNLALDCLSLTRYLKRARPSLIKLVWVAVKIVSRILVESWRFASREKMSNEHRGLQTVTFAKKR